MSNKNLIKERVLLNQSDGNPFAFMIDLESSKQKWYVVSFLFHRISPSIICTYSVDEQLVYNGNITQLSSSSFESLNDLVDYLFQMSVIPDYCRAIH